MIGGVSHGRFELNHSDLAVRNILAIVLSLYPPFDVEKPDGGLFEARKRSMHIYLDPLGLGHFGLSALDRQNFEFSLGPFN